MPETVDTDDDDGAGKLQNDPAMAHSYPSARAFSASTSPSAQDSGQRSKQKSAPSSTEPTKLPFFPLSR